MTDPSFDLKFDQRVNLLLDQRSRLLDSLILANERLEEKADRCVQNGGVLFGLTAFVTALPVSGLFKIAERTSEILTWSLLGAIIVSLIAFILMIVLAKMVNTTKPWEAPGDTDWDKNSTTYLAEKSYDNLLADLLKSIKSVKEINDTKSRYVGWIYWCLVAEALMVATVLTITLITR